MSEHNLTQQVVAFNKWKKDIIRQMIKYRGWLKTNRVDTEEFTHRLNHNLRHLQSDQINLAFIGEFSRGKSELINSLFFADYGQRLLPSQIGRTTMCPTELFFDQTEKTSYLKLLPIETRKTNASISSYKKVPDKWMSIPLDINNPERMSAAFKEVASTKLVSEEQAAELGFDPKFLEPSVDGRGNVTVPAWRHALISFDHPLLRQGLTIIDTPGLNALGAEPELTLSLLPEAQAIVFVLSADTDVTSTDLETWNSYIRDLSNKRNVGLYAALNKIDILWDDIDGPDEINKSISSLQSLTAKQLGISPAYVIPLSAKKGLIGKLKNDPVTLARSNIFQLENLLSDTIMSSKESRVQNAVVDDMVTMVGNSRKLIHERLKKIQQQKKSLHSNSATDEHELMLLTKKAKKDQAFYQKKLLILKSSRKMMENQVPKLLQFVSPASLAQYKVESNSILEKSWTNLGINSAVNNFFERLESDFRSLKKELAETEQRIDLIYSRYEEEQYKNDLVYPKLDINTSLEKLEDLKQQANQTGKSVKNIFSKQKTVVSRYYNGVIEQASQYHRDLYKNTKNWGNEALAPIMQQTMEQKRTMDEYLIQLKQLSQSKNNAKHTLQTIDEKEAFLIAQYKELDQILKILRIPAPAARAQKVVTLPGGDARA